MKTAPVKLGKHQSSSVLLPLGVPADLPGKPDHPLHLPGWSVFVEQKADDTFCFSVSLENKLREDGKKNTTNSKKINK